MGQTKDDLGISIPFISFNIDALAGAVPDDVDILKNSVNKTLLEAGQHKHRAESKKERLKNIMEMLAAIFSSYIVSMIPWESFHDFITGHY